MFSSYLADGTTWILYYLVRRDHMENAEVTKTGAGTVALLISPDAGMLSELAPLLSHNLPGVRIVPVKEYPDTDALAEILNVNAPRMCFLDVESDTKQAVALIHDFQTIDARLQTVVLLNGNSPDLILHCLRQGAAEFLIQPFTAEDLRPVLHRLSQLSPTISYGKGGKIICVAPPKGACGASTIATNLAHRKKRLGSKKLLLVDLDSLSGTVSFLLKLKSNYSFHDAVNRVSGLDTDLWAGMVSSSNGFDALLAPENPMDTIQDIPDPTPVLEFARQLYDTVIVDCPGVLGDSGLALANVSDELLLVTTNELPALQATQRVLAHLDRHRVEHSKLRLIVNRYSREVGLSSDAIATALHMDVYQIIPSDYASVQRALVEGKPISPNCAFGRSMAALTDRLSGKKPSTPKKPKKSPLGGILSSIFSKATI